VPESPIPRYFVAVEMRQPDRANPSSAVRTRTLQATFYFNPILQKLRNQHHTYADYLLLPQSKQGHQVATFVRNPYDRVVSGFMQLCRDASVIPQLQFADRDMKLFILDQVAQNTQDIIRSSYNLNAWFLNLSPYKILDSTSVTFLLQPAHIWTQLGNQKIDFIGKVENFEADFEKLKSRYGIGPTSLESVNQSDLKATAVPAAPYRYAQRLHSKTIARINDIFSQDFELLGYDRLTA
jgi:Sulfotransferase family